MKHKCIYSIAIVSIFLLFSCNKRKVLADNSSAIASKTLIDSKMYLFVGTYTSGTSEGIYVYEFDSATADSKLISTVKVENPSYLTISDDEKHVYAVSECSEEKALANAFSFNKENGELSFLNSLPTQGADPCYIAVDKRGERLVTANYSGGNISMFNLNTEGSIDKTNQIVNFIGKSVDRERQNKPHLHCVKFSPDGRYLFACDLGTDKIHKFSIDDNNDFHIGTPDSFKLNGGSGPRHLEFHPNGRYAYVINELSGSVVAFNYDSVAGNLTQLQTIQADTLNAQGSADIHITSDGRFLYASNRLEGDGLAIFSVNHENGTLTKIGYQGTGIHPRNFIITPNDKYLLVACRNSNVIQVFNIDHKTGLLQSEYKDIIVDQPVCLKFASKK